jgi:hypothetical protein
MHSQSLIGHSGGPIKKFWPCKCEFEKNKLNKGKSNLANFVEG